MNRNQPPSPHNPIASLNDEALQLQISYRARQREWACEIHLNILQSIPIDELPDADLEYRRELQAETIENQLHPQKKAKGNNQKALTKRVRCLCHKGSELIPTPGKSSR